MLTSASRSLMVEDAVADPYFTSLPITHDIGIGAYTGVPLYYSDGRLYGTLCTLHPQERVVPDGELGLLTLAGRIVMQALEARETEMLRRQHALILRYAGEGICGLDAAGTITFVNRALEEMTGYEGPEVLGQRWEDMFGHRDAGGRAFTSEESPIRRALAGGTVERRSRDFLKRKDGTDVSVEYTCTPIMMDGSVAGAVLTLQDMTERHAVERMKDEFISVVSHELRTPLTSIRGSLGLVAAEILGELPAEAKAMLEIAVSNTDRLVRLVNDILDIERIESGRVAMERVPCRSGTLGSGAVEVMRAMAERANVSLVMDVTDIDLVADPDRMTQVLTNLLSNAIKFSPPDGTVWLETAVSATDITFSVRDQGRGVPADKREAIFERFQQVDASDSREKGGTGLGLPIARSIVQQHGGRMWVESEVGAGSTFRFTLPLGAAPSQPAAAPREIPAPPVASREGLSRSVLVVEDDVDLTHVLLRLFDEDDVAVFQVRTAEEAIVASQRVTPDVLVLDLGLAEGTGFEVVNWLRHHESLQYLPIVVYTARDLSPDEIASLKRPDVQIVTKGRMAPEDFERLVVDLVHRVSGEREH